MTVELRDMTVADLPAVMVLEEELFAPDTWTEWMYRDELARTDTRHYLVAEDGGTVVGYAGIFATRHQADVQTVAVAPGRQGSGLGALLLQALVDEARRRGCAEVLLEVRVDNGPALGLYERFGFERISVRRGYYQPGGVDGLVLRLRL